MFHEIIFSISILKQIWCQLSNVRLGFYIIKLPAVSALEVPFKKNEMGGLLRARHKTCNSGRRDIWFITGELDSGRFAHAFPPALVRLVHGFSFQAISYFLKGTSDAKECLLNIMQNPNRTLLVSSNKVQGIRCKVKTTVACGAIKPVEFIPENRQILDDI
jgi:hypothetical protein